MTRPVYLALCLPKCGSHSVQRMFAESDLDEGRVWYKAPTFVGGPQASAGLRTDFVVGHFRVKQNHRGVENDRPRHLATLLREPTERLRSHFSSEVDGIVARGGSPEDLDPEEFCARWRDVVVRWISTDGTVETATKTLRSPLTVWGLTKRLDEWRERVNEAWGIDLPSVPPTHVGTKRAFHALDSKLVAASTVKDRALWKWVLERTRTVR